MAARLDTRLDSYVIEKLHGYAPPVLVLVLLMCLPTFLAIILLRGPRIKLFDDVPPIEALISPYVRFAWLVILATAAAPARSRAKSSPRSSTAWPCPCRRSRSSLCWS